MNENSKLKIENCRESVSLRLSIHGDVQGVNYRYFARKEALKFDLVGWVANTRDGRVEAFVQGDPEAAQKFIDWCKEGSPMATVEEVLVETAEPDNNLRNFEVR